MLQRVRECAKKGLPLAGESLIFPRFPANGERGVAQSGSAVALGAIGREFESLRPDHSKSTDSSDSVDFSFEGAMKTRAGEVKLRTH